MTALAVRLGIISEQVREDPDLAAAMIEQAEVELDLSIDELRELAHGIHPTLLTSLGLAKAIESVAKRSPIQIQLVELPRTRVDAGAEAAAYYVVAEAIANAQKHAHASSIRVRVTEVAGQSADRDR